MSFYQLSCDQLSFDQLLFYHFSFDQLSFDELSVDEASFVVVDHEDPSDDTPELEGETDPSTKTFAPTSTMEFGDTDDISRSPEIKDKIDKISIFFLRY